MTTLGSRADFGVILKQDLPEQEIPELLRHSTFLSAKERTTATPGPSTAKATWGTRTPCP